RVALSNPTVMRIVGKKLSTLQDGTSGRFGSIVNESEFSGASEKNVRGRMPHNLKTIHALLQRNSKAFIEITHRKHHDRPEVREGIRTDIIRDRAKALELVEEL